MLTTTLNAFTCLGLLLLCCLQQKTYIEKKKQNNDTAVRNRNLSYVFGILCIIMFASLVANINNFSTNHSKNVKHEGKTMQHEAFMTTQSDGTLVPKAFLLTNLIPVAVIRIKTLRYRIIRKLPGNEIKILRKGVICTKVFVVKQIPLHESYLN